MGGTTINQLTKRYMAMKQIFVRYKEIQTINMRNGIQNWLTYSKINFIFINGVTGSQTMDSSKILQPINRPSPSTKTRITDVTTYTSCTGWW
jgi:hypothetical protein